MNHEMTDEDVVLRLDRHRALVLFEFLSRFGDDASLSIKHQAEERVLWDLCGALQRELVEPFRPDYDQLLDAARKWVADDTEPGERT